jgi:hypothetical protein
MSENRINMTPFVSAILAVLAEPYQDFVARLQSEGRITDAEVADLRQAILDRGSRLADLVQERLPPEGGTAPR